MKGIADTGFLVAFVNRADEHHDWAVSIAEQVTEPSFPSTASLRSIARTSAFTAVTSAKRSP